MWLANVYMHVHIYVHVYLCVKTCARVLNVIYDMQFA